MSPTSMASNAGLGDVQRQNRIQACIYFQSLISGTGTQSSLTPLIWRKNLGTAAKSVNVLHCRIARIVLTHRVRTVRCQRFQKIYLVYLPNTTLHWVLYLSYSLSVIRRLSWWAQFAFCGIMRNIIAVFFFFHDFLKLWGKASVSARGQV